MTDEDIVKALEVCGTDYECNNCPYVEECCERVDGNAGLLIKALDLIHRLQAENEELKYAREVASRESKQFVEYATKVNAEQKAEIERLTEQKEFWEAKHDELCRKLEEREDKSEEYENAITMKQYRIDELKKQVDELRKSISIFEHIQIADTPTLSDKFVPVGHNGPVGEKGACGLANVCGYVHQAVKDTAKECISIIDDEFDNMIECINVLLKDNGSMKIVKSAVKGVVNSTKDNVMKRYGVEVK